MPDKLAHFENGQWHLSDLPSGWDWSWLSPMLHGVLSGVATILFLTLLWRSRAILFVKNNQVCILERRWSRKGSINTGLIALHGEAGFLPDVLRGGLHFMTPFMYRAHFASLVSIPQGTMGYVFARSGTALGSGQALGKDFASGFEDARAFLDGGGQRGPQRSVLREGTYPINLAQFVVFTEDATYGIDLDDADEVKATAATIKEHGGWRPVVIRDGEDTVGVVTIHDGPPLLNGVIIAPVVADHMAFQNPEAFLSNGGHRGRQQQVLVEGTWYLNRLFATVEPKPKTAIAVGFAGVVISYAGDDGADVSGDDFRHGQLVETGQRGVWAQPLNPGKYALNPYAMEVRPVPVTNFVLRWVSGSTEAHKLDANLSEIRLITRDAFEPTLPLSVVVHIDYEKAPRIVQRFADLRLLVEQTLDPMVSAYFRDAAQSSTLLELIQQRAELQKKAKEDMAKRFAEYDLNLHEVMIGTPTPDSPTDTMVQVLDQLRQRQVAVEQVSTFEHQRVAQEKRRELTEASAKAEAQAHLTTTEVGITVADNEGRAILAVKSREAEAIKVTAVAEASRIELTGKAQATAIEAQVRASGGADFQLRRVVAEEIGRAIREATVQVVPTVQGGGDGSSQGGMISFLTAMMIKDRTDGN